MKPRDWLILATIVGALTLMFVVTRSSQPERVKPGSPEYDAYIERSVAECMRNAHALERSEQEPPSEAEREAACRVSVLHADRLYPDNRPLRHP